ncbi:unnamed protein product [Caenorhabditis sp. 36 PRJEB53466]|nr:unnamed protein product [Caenorhabditis sp. 36 PRJEB53466]
MADKVDYVILRVSGTTEQRNNIATLIYGDGEQDYRNTSIGLGAYRITSADLPEFVHNAINEDERSRRAGIRSEHVDASELESVSGRLGDVVRAVNAALLNRDEQEPEIAYYGAAPSAPSGTRGRGRPPGKTAKTAQKAAVSRGGDESDEAGSDKQDDDEDAPPVRRGRGRPPMKKAKKTTESVVTKRKRGRPPTKKDGSDKEEDVDEDLADNIEHVDDSVEHVDEDLDDSVEHVDDSVEHVAEEADD